MISDSCIVITYKGARLPAGISFIMNDELDCSAIATLPIRFFQHFSDGMNPVTIELVNGRSKVLAVTNMMPSPMTGMFRLELRQFDGKSGWDAPKNASDGQ